MPADPFARLDAVIGPVAAMSLQQRQLLPPAGPELLAGVAVVDPDPDRRLAALLGASIGAVLGVPLDGARPDAAPRSLVEGLDPAVRPVELSVLSVALEALDDGGALGGEALARRLAGFRPRRRSQAFTATVANLHRGIPWFEAGVPSLGSSVAPRGIAEGLRFADDPSWRAIAACVDAAVTHAHPEAVGVAALVAEAVAWALAQPEGALSPTELVEHLATCSWDPVLAAGLRRLPSMADATAPLAATVLGAGATAQRALLTAVLGLLRGGGTPETSLLATVELGGDVAAAATVVGAVLGAAHGPAWTVRHQTLLHGLRERLDPAAAALALDLGWEAVTPRAPGDDRWRCTLGGAPQGVEVDGGGGAADASPVHVAFLLDRSGSMGPLAGDVVGGFNRFLADQRAIEGGECTMTVVQFDSAAPFEVVVDARPLADVPELTLATYQPRGGTPLYDAIDSTISSVEQRIAARAVAGLPVGEVVVVVFTDGLENASQRCGRAQVMARIKTKQDVDDWTFVFLGANQDAYASGAGLGVASGSTSGWSGTAKGSEAVFRSMSRGIAEYRGKPSMARRLDKAAFFGGVKEAEDPDAW